MSKKKTNVYSINYTDEDRETLLKSMFIDMLIKRDHPELEEKAAKLVKNFMKQTNQPEN